MPELPEVETIRRALTERLATRMIVGVQVLTQRLRTELNPVSLNAAVGSVLGVRRRAKYLIVDFATEPAGATALQIHLGMTGALRIEPLGLAAGKHDHVIWSLDRGEQLVFHDPRRFGRVEAVRLGDDGWPPTFAHLGPEPLEQDFTAAALYAGSRGRTVTIKSWLMDQRNVVGVGNIYASEALFRAGIHPRRGAGQVSRPRYARLVTAIQAVLSEAIAAGGTRIRDFGGLDGSDGRFVRQLRVYGKSGNPCPTCGHPIRSLRLGGRATYYCPRCQR